MSKERDIKEAIQQIAREGGTLQGMFYVADVVSASDDECVVDIDGLQLSGVRTGAIVDDNTNKLRIKPKAGSKVMVADLYGDKTQLMVVSFSEIESITINGGNLGGLVEIEKLKDNLNSLKSYVDDLQTLAATAMSPMSALDKGTSVGTFNATWNTKKSTFSWENMEDTKIKH